MSTLVSVCLPVRNGGQTIAAVADSVLGQTYSDVELVISDNASTDDTEAVCRELAARDLRGLHQRSTGSSRTTGVSSLPSPSIAR